MIKEFVNKVTYRRRRLKLAKLLESRIAENHFYMGSFISHPTLDEGEVPIGKMVGTCGSTACIAGWAAAMGAPETVQAEGSQRNTIYLAAKNFLGLDEEQANDLFYSNTWMNDPKDAAKVVRHLAATNEVDWSKADA